jgi:hypothetical protein
MIMMVTGWLCDCMAYRGLPWVAQSLPSAGHNASRTFETLQNIPDSSSLIIDWLFPSRTSDYYSFIILLFFDVFSDAIRFHVPMQEQARAGGGT